MRRLIKLIGSDEGVQLEIDDEKKMILTQGESINALDFYQALDYHPGDSYKLTESDNGPIPEGSFKPLKDLVEAIAKGINGILGVEGMDPDEADNDALDQNGSVED